MEKTGEIKMSWDKLFIDAAELFSTKSKDPSTKIGAVIIGPDNEVRSVGFNGFPRGVEDDPKAFDHRYERPAKYSYTEHAERNAIYNAARVGLSLKDCTLYMNYNPHEICPDCARAIIQSGIKKVIGPVRSMLKPENRKQWEDTFKITDTMFSEASIWVEEVDSNL